MTQVKLLTDAIDDFIKGCKADGNWDQIKACCIMAAWDKLNGALVPIKGPAPTNFNFVSDDYDRVTGLKGDGSTKYLDSNRANDADPQNSNHNAVFITLASSGTVQTSAYMGSDEAAEDGGNILFSRDSGDLRFKLRSSVLSELPDQGGRTGMKGVSRSSASQETVRSSGSDNIVSSPSSAPTSANVYVFDRGLTPPNRSTDARLSFYSIGESIDLAALDARVSALMTALDGAIA